MPAHAAEIRPIKLHPSWLKVLGGEFDKPYIKTLREFLVSEKSLGKVIYPVSDHWFAAFNKTPFLQVKVVILGQDPYHGPNQAHGLCFSVPAGIDVPPSLANIYRELENDLGIVPASHGCLDHWAEQGVLLLNATLTVVRGQAGSHQNQGWETLTDSAIRVLNDQRDGLVIMLWGSYAQKKGDFIDQSKHLVIRSPHPSPLAAYRGFFGSKPFSRANEYLEAHDKEPVDWRLPPA